MATNTITSVYQGGMNFNTVIKDHTVKIDLEANAGGNNLGTSPKILMLVSLAGCTGLDVVGILHKMKVSFSDFHIDINAHLTDTDPKIYDEVKVTYNIKTDKGDEAKMQKAVNLSQEKYCGVSEMFRRFAMLTHEIVYL